MTGRGPSRGPRLRVAVAALAVFASCASPARPGPVLPAGPAVIEVAMTEYRFAFNQEVPAGRVVFTVTNAGRMGHRLALLPLADDVPPIADQLKGNQRRVVQPFAGVPDRRPGQSGAFAADLVAGRRYAFICFLTNPDGKSHARLGMNAEFRAGGTISTTTTTTQRTG